jgi:hypothetical protein
MTVYPETINGLRAERDDQADRLLMAGRTNARLRADNATLRALLREAAPKCDHHPEQCDKIATWWAEDVVESRVALYYCEEHRNDYGVDHEPYDLGRRIKAALEEQP